jgi:hypothetical protein
MAEECLGGGLDGLDVFNYMNAFWEVFDNYHRLGKTRERIALELYHAGAPITSVYLQGKLDIMQSISQTNLDILLRSGLITREKILKLAPMNIAFFRKLGKSLMAILRLQSPAE